MRIARASRWGSDRSWIARVEVGVMRIARASRSGSGVEVGVRPIADRDGAAVQRLDPDALTALWGDLMPVALAR